MGCVSSKLLRKDFRQEVFINVNGGDYVNHVVSLTSSTYGALKLDTENSVVECVEDSKRVEKSPPREDPEVINAWELMEGLEDGVPVSNQAKKSPKNSPFLRGFIGPDSRSPFKLLNQLGSPKTVKKSVGKENKMQGNLIRGGMRRLDYSPKGVLKSSNFSPKSCNKVLNSAKGSPICASRNSFGSDSGHSSRKRSPTPLFDPELLANYEKELSEEEEQIKRMVWATPKGRRSRKSKDTETILDKFEKICPPGEENSVVIYTTTLRGIRKTFEDCNKVRLILESYEIRIFERDISMDAGFKEELRQLMGTKGVKVPMVFVKGRLIGGIEEVMKLEEEERLGVLFEGIPRARSGCEGCGDVRFVMCVKCNGSCKVLDKEHQKTVKCGQCNENGLIQCPVCC